MRTLALAASLLLAACATAPSAHMGEHHDVSSAGIAASWDASRIDPILARTSRLHLAPDVSALTPGEQIAVRELVQAGEAMHRLYMTQRHPQALAAAQFVTEHPELTGVRDLFRLSSGPIATTLDNTREPFLTVSPETPARNVYPAGVTRETMDAFIAANPARRETLLDDRTVVVDATDENRAHALMVLDHHPVLDTLHPGLRARLQSEQTYLALPYSVAYAHEILEINQHLNAAADAVEDGDPAFARYLRLRARDLLADDYEGGDAAWVTGDFTGNLNAQIGAYETYDDAMYGVKTFFSLSLLVRDRARSAELQESLQYLQRVEDSLPYESDREVRSDIPVAVYNIIAYFGMAWCR
jgi:hypothetical protein